MVGCEELFGYSAPPMGTTMCYDNGECVPQYMDTTGFCQIQAENKTCEWGIFFYYSGLSTKFSSSTI